MEPLSIQLETGKQQLQARLDTTATEVDSYLLVHDDPFCTHSFKTEKTFSTTDGLSIFGEIPVSPSFGRWELQGIGRIVNHRRFKRAVISCIVLNSILEGISTFDAVTENEDMTNLFRAIDGVFLVLFTIEVFLQFAHRGLALFSDGWLVFDFVIVSASWFFTSMLVIRSFRIVRTIQLATRIQELQNLVRALLQVIPKMFAIMFLLCLLFWVSAVLFTELFKNLYRDGYTSEDYFSRLDVTCFTLFQIMTLDGWSTVTKEVMKVHQWSWLPFIAFVMTSSFFFLNLIIAVVCEAVSAVQQEQYVKNIEQAQQSRCPTAQDLARMEEKIDQLSTTVEILLRMHMVQMQSIHEQNAFAETQSTPSTNDCHT